MNELCYLSATDALKAFRDKSLSPLELTRAIIDRAESIATTVNPYADTYFEQALERAKKAEKKYVTGARVRRLEGIPLAVKDAATIKGTRTTVGSLMHAERIDEQTDPNIQRLISAGANVFAKTTCPEFCWLFTCHSRAWGVTRNPWRLDITPGGSSGGAGAALAAGGTTLATGSDSTGSIRQPAAQCGVIGYKAPYGRNPLSAKSSFDPYVHVGPMTRSVGDAALMQNVMSGHHPLDHNSLKAKLSIPQTLSGIDGLKLAFSMDLGHYEVVDDVRRETLSTLDTLRSLGASVDVVDINWANDAIRLSHLAEEFIFAGSLNEAIASHGALLSDYVPELAETANKATAEDFRQAHWHAGDVWAEHFGPLFKTYDAFLCPTVSCPEVPAEGWQQTPLHINGRTLTDTDTAMTAIFNMFNRCPVMSVPSGLTDAGLPTSLQIVGRPYDDITTFRIAHALEQAQPWWTTETRRPQRDTFCG